MNARRQAFEVLYGVMASGQYASLSLRADRPGEQAADRALLTRIVYGTLQNYRYVRWQWQRFVSRMPAAKVAVLLDMSAYQLLFMDRLPAYAVISQAVDMSRDIGQGSYAGLVNATLRNLARQGAAPVTDGDPVTRLGLETSHPDWLVRLWQSHYGPVTAAAICHEDLQPDVTALRVNTLATTRDKMLAADARFAPGPIDDSLFYDGDILATSWFKDHLVAVQSLSSQQAVGYVQAAPGDDILDMCAAPGTKTIQMAMAMRGQGHVTAIDIHPQRVALIADALGWYGITNVTALCADSTALTERLGDHRFGKVLLDAPCSGLGTLRNKADIKLRIQPQDIDQLAAIQSGLLDSAAAMSAVGGIVVYSTCTLDKKENERQVAAFLNRHQGFTLDAQRTIMPMEWHSDGFYMARLRHDGPDMLELTGERDERK